MNEYNIANKYNLDIGYDTSNRYGLDSKYKEYIIYKNDNKNLYEGKHYILKNKMNKKVLSNINFSP